MSSADVLEWDSTALHAKTASIDINPSAFLGFAASD